MKLQVIQQKIFEIRGQKIMLDFDLAELYEVPTKALNQAVKRNLPRFPLDFMFRLTIDEWEGIRSQIETASGNINTMRSQNVTASQKKRNITATPYAFTEQGLAMLSGILNSKKAIAVNIAIMRTFVMIRQYALTYKDLTDKITELEAKYNKKFADVYEVLKLLIDDKKERASLENRERFGYKKEWK